MCSRLELRPRPVSGTFPAGGTVAPAGTRAGSLTGPTASRTIGAMALIEAPEQAMRLARAICSDISLYNEEKIVRSIQQDNFFDALKDELAEGRDLFKSRVAPDTLARTNFFDRAVVDVILKPKGRLRSKIW